MVESGAEVELTVGAVAGSLGVPVATLRSWNQRYGLGPGSRRPGEHRHYTAGDVVVLRRMVDLIRAGVGPRNAAKAARAAAAERPTPGNIEPLPAAADRLDATELLDIVATHIAHFGVVTTWNSLCRPAFTDLVARQRRGHGLVDVEHTLSGAITIALHRTVPPVRAPAGATPVLLACTGGEGHVLPLEVLRATLAETGIPAVLLGASVPSGALADAVARQPRTPVVVLWSQTARTAPPEPVQAGSRAPARLLLAGPGWAVHTAPAGALRVASLDDALQLIDRLRGRTFPRGPYRTRS
ncbi:MerR family transcriptional regulator [Nocardia sp. NBC_01329]|uniref:MerR family transcriptional regulator n=1 Tax=Nocardia sp. NBC_01329 TaxID=2903594 RepID=UPI002E137175|nr:MerR family transcriptional regulator [Nocardia sp. NBC_01329]